MALTVTPNLTLINNCDSDNWSGGNSNDIMQKQGSACMSDFVDDQLGTLRTYTIPTAVDMSGGEHLYIWMMCFGIVESQANGGYRVYLADSSANNATWYAGGYDTHGANTGWQLMVVDLDATPDESSGTLNKASIKTVGVRFYTTTEGPSQGANDFDNVFWDVVRYGTGLTITSASTDDITLADIYAVDDALANKYGALQRYYGSYLQSGEITFGGTGTETIDFVMSNEVLGFPSNPYVATDFYSLLPLGNTTNPTYIDIAGSIIKAAGSEKFSFDCTGANINTFSMIGTQLNNAGEAKFVSGQTVTNNTFVGCDMVTPGASTFQYNVISESSDTDALYCEGDLDDLDFVSDGTGHAILIDSTGTYDFTNITFDNYASSDGSTGNECVYNNSGGAVTINISGGDTPTIHNGTSATTTLIVSPVEFRVTVKDLTTSSVIENAQTLAWVADGTNFPYEDSVTIVSSGTTATVTHNAHGLATGDDVIIEGANEDSYNGAYEITYVSDTVYTYTMAEADTSPATGTITATFAYINEDTNASGIATDTRSISANQAVVGWARKADGSPYYQQGVISGTVDKDSGLLITLQLARDE